MDISLVRLQIDWLTNIFLAYQDVFSESRRLQKEIQTPKSAVDDKLFEEIETLIATQYTPQLVRHIQILWRALNDHQVKMYY